MRKVEEARALESKGLKFILWSLPLLFVESHMPCKPSGRSLANEYKVKHPKTADKLWEEERKKKESLNRIFCRKHFRGDVEDQ